MVPGRGACIYVYEEPNGWFSSSLRSSTLPSPSSDVDIPVVYGSWYAKEPLGKDAISTVPPIVLTTADWILRSLQARHSCV